MAENELGTYIPKRLYERVKAAAGNGSPGFVYDEKFPSDLRIHEGVYLEFYEVRGKQRKVQILVSNEAIGEKARDILAWKDDYVVPESVTEGEFRLKVEGGDKKIIDEVRVTRGNIGFLEVSLKGEQDKEKILDAMLKCAISPLILAVQQASREEPTYE